MNRTFNQTGSDCPVAYIAKSKQRLKQYEDTVYLKNGDEFEIELFNPSQSKVLARIELNKISIGPGIILRPGERVFLDRYVTEAKKFLFETYKVSGSNDQVKKAIENNGDVIVKFFKEDIYVANNITTNTYTFPERTIFGGPFYDSNIYGSGNSGGLKNLSNMTNLNNDIIGGCFPRSATKGFSGSNSTPTSAYSSSIPTMDFLDMDMEMERSVIQPASFSSFSSIDYAPEEKFRGIVDNPSKGRAKMSASTKLSKRSDEIETGRVEKGSKSDQTFKADYTKFEYTYSWKSEWKLLPESRKEITSDDIIVYCTKCGRKRRKGENFCPADGNKF